MDRRAAHKPLRNHERLETTMSKDQKDTVRIELTEEQKKQLRETTGRDANALAFSVQELEERIAPARLFDGGEGLA
jgi:hypothetical protein